jgi:hypothetical protein
MKKGQVTLFVIIGAIILLAATLYFTLSSSLQEGEPGVDVVDVSLETRPTFDVVKQCLNKVSLDGLRLLGNQGGWIEFPGMTYNDLPYASDIVSFTPYKIAYWRHLYECGNYKYCEESNRPPLCKPGSGATCASSNTGDYSIQEQLENYIDQNLEPCLDNFNSLSDQYQIEVKGKPKSEVIFAPKGTRVLLNYPLEIKSLKSDNTRELEDYGVDFNINFAEMYNFASSILNYGKQVNFYERQTMNLVTIYSGLNEPLPPTSDVQFFNPETKIWVQPEVKEILQYDLLPFMSLINFMNAKNYYPIYEEREDEYTKYSDGIYMGMNPKLGDDNTQYPYNVYHQYTYNPIYVKVGNGNTLIKPSNLEVESNIIMKFAGLFMKDYRFKYDIRYPLVITINDDEALNGEGFDLNFAVEVNVRNNVPAYNNFTNLNIDAPYQTGIANLEVRLPQNITITSYDKYLSTPLQDVLVSYVCGREYDFGVTKLNSKGQATFTTTLPYCEIGGYLKFTKKGYAGTTLAYDNKLDGKNAEFTAELWPLQEKEIIILKRTPEDISAIQIAGGDAMVLYDQLYSTLENNEVAMINIENQKSNPYDETIPTMGFLKYQQPQTTATQTTGTSPNTIQAIEKAFQEGTIDGETRNQLMEEINKLDPVTESFTGQDKYTLELSPGTYDLDISLFNYNGTYIPSDTIDPCEGDLITELICNEDPVTLPEQNFTTWLSGGIKLNLTLNPATIYSDKKIILYVLEMPLPQSWDDMQELQEIEQYQEDKLFFAIPKFE